MWCAFLHDLNSCLSTPVSSNVSTPQPFRLKTGVSDTSRPLQTLRSTEIESTVESVFELVRLMWTTGLLEAGAWLEQHKYEPRCALHWAECGFLNALLIGSKQSRKIALERLEYAEKISEGALKALESTISLLLNCNPKEMNSKEILSVLKDSQKARISIAASTEIFLFRAGSEILQKDYPRGSIHFRNAWKQFKLSTELQKAYTSLENLISSNLKKELSKTIENDILSMLQFQEGAFLLSLSMAPPSLLRLAKMSGMEADQTKGLDMLYKCINSKTGIRVSGALMFVLFWLLVYIPEFAPGKEERFKEASELIRYGNYYYPRSIYFSWLESYMCTRQGKLERALKLLKRALEYACEQGFEIHSLRLLFEKGWVLFLCQEWEQSLSCLLTVADDCPPTPFTQMLLAINYCMVGNLDHAETTFKDLCSQGLEKSTVEKWIGRRAKRYLSRRWFQLFPYELIYVTDYLNVMNFDWLEQVLGFLSHIDIPESSEAEKSNQNSYRENDEYVVMLLLKGAILRNLGRLTESVKVFEKLITYQTWIMNEKWTVPHTYYELGMVHLKGRDWKTASHYFTKAKKFKKFDFRRSLNFKLNNAIQYINQEEIKEAKFI